MGQPKLVLPWHDTTVIGQVVRVLGLAGISEIVVVSGGAHTQILEALHHTPARVIFNPRYTEDQMILSLQAGLAELPKTVRAVVLALGDQPQIEPEVVDAVIACYEEVKSGIVVPSYHMRRGHPVLIDQSLMPDLLALQPPATLRDYLNAHPERIHYLTVERESILKDLDTPDDYMREAQFPG
jgi:molybdenum cofactor cytidylyltransferase